MDLKFQASNARARASATQRTSSGKAFNCCAKELLCNFTYLLKELNHDHHHRSIAFQEFQSATTPSALLFSPSFNPTPPLVVDAAEIEAFVFNLFFIFCVFTPLSSLSFCLFSAAFNICSLRSAMSSGESCTVGFEQHAPISFLSSSSLTRYSYRRNDPQCHKLFCS